MRIAKQYYVAASAVILGSAALLALTMTGQVQAESVTRVSNDHCVSSPLSRVHVLDDSTLLVVDQSGSAAQLKLSGTCLKDRSASIAVEYAGGASRICHANDATVRVRLGNVDLNCNIASVKSVSLDEARKSGSNNNW
jgi:hypothetical protein